VAQRTLLSYLSALSCLALASTACGVDDTQAGAIGTTAPTTAALAPPERIVPVDGDLAEIVFALGLGEQVVATDISATHPPAADALPEIGYQRALAAEPIVAFDPTIVLATDIAGPVETLDDLERLGVEVVMIPNESSSDGPGNKIRAVAAALGVDATGQALADTVDAEIAAASARVDDVTPSLKVGVLYVRGKNVQLLLGEGGGVDWMIEAAGAIDIADELGIVDNAPINAESLVAAAPDVLIIPERGLESVGGIDGLLELPGIAETPAGQTGRVVAYDDQYLLGNGPRTGQFLDQLITDLHGDI
jgi:heme transport system substrate-binding protein